MKILDILDKLLKGILVILFVFGCGQFLFLATATLFGFYFHWLQYTSSLILLAVGLISIRFLLKMFPEE